MTIETFIPYIGAGLLAVLTYALGMTKRKTLNKKLAAETEAINTDVDFRLIKFYEGQVQHLTERVEELCSKLEEKIQQYENCVVKVEDLEKKYNQVIIKLKKLSNDDKR